MTTPDIPDAAVNATAAVLAAWYGPSPDNDWADDARNLLANALPHLGKTTEQYGVQGIDNIGKTMTIQCSGLLDAEHEIKNVDPAAEPRIVVRANITGPWQDRTEVNR